MTNGSHRVGRGRHGLFEQLPRPQHQVQHSLRAPFRSAPKDHWGKFPDNDDDPCQSDLPRVAKRARGKGHLASLRDARRQLDLRVVRCEEGKAAVEAACFLREAAAAVPEGARELTQFAPRCILLHGPPGTGKTLLASAAAAVLRWDAVHLSARSVLSKWAGESEKGVAAAFATAHAREPCVLILDECDALAGARAPGGVEGGEGSGPDPDVGARRVTTELLLALSRLDRLHPAARVVAVAITNTPELLDPAFVRRFDRIVHMGLPGLDGRRDLVLRFLASCSHSVTEADVDSIVQASHGLSTSALLQWCRAAALRPVTEWLHQALTGDDDGVGYEAAEELTPPGAGLRRLEGTDFTETALWAAPEQGPAEPDAAPPSST